ncbi:MAG: hypothetical protein P4L16_06825, partial [Chlamydiales bacterium]|nr:hypothetical protein [Chlamydiales bacterium]
LGTPSGLLWLANWITTFIKSTKEEEYFHNTWIIPPIDRDTTYAEHSIYLKKVTSHEKHPILSFEYKNEDLNTLYIFGNEEGLKGLVYEIWGYAFDKDDDSFCRTSSNFTGGDFVPQTLGGLDFHPFQSWKILGGMYFTEKYDPLNRSRYSLGITLEEYDSWEKEVLRRYVNERIVLP